MAKIFAQKLGADILSIDIENPYNGTYEETIERCKEEREHNVLHKLCAFDTDLSQYDTIFLGFPVWFGTYAPPIASLLAEQNFDGKTIVPFCTFGSGGLCESTELLKQALPNVTILEGYGVRTIRIEKAENEIEQFLVANGFLPGEIEVKPEYGEAHPVTDEEIAIFEAACSDYQYPLGKPIAVAKRSTANSNDYKFTVDSNAETEWTIWVTVASGENAKPEFTLVTR